MDPYLSLSNVTKSFPTKQGTYLAVDNFSLDIARGEIVSLIGHSGCGKSTVLGMVAGLQRPSSGAITLDGRVVTEPGPDRGVVFQNYSLLPWMTVWDNIFEAVDSAVTDLPRAEKRERTEEFLRLVGLWEHRLKRPAQISGGMKQRVAIARAFSVHPEVLLLDEPFGALDALTRASLQQELVKLWALDNSTETVVLVTHDIDEAIYLSDRVVVMTNGPAATIREIVEVPLPRPRDQQRVMVNPKYRLIREHLWNLLTHVNKMSAA